MPPFYENHPLHGLSGVKLIMLLLRGVAAHCGVQLANISIPEQKKMVGVLLKLAFQELKLEVLRQCHGMIGPLTREQNRIINSHYRDDFVSPGCLLHYLYYHAASPTVYNWIDVCVICCCCCIKRDFHFIEGTFYVAPFFAAAQKCDGIPSNDQ